MRTILKASVFMALAIALAAFSSVAGKAASAAELDVGANATMQKLFLKVRSGHDLANRAAGILVFPQVVKAGMGIGGEYGEGVLMIGGRPAAYYNTISASIGFQLGAQARSVVIMFMTPEALDSFRRKQGWKVTSTARWHWSRSARAVRSTPTRSTSR